ncbi:MAG: helix-turn-helix transcriptional regulator [Paraglaciecola sp.]|uniref:helix-turn-helix transcriptional regulator n=1 Tax=Paraglaciecola sp. TaxID=1920173 RepID=UPI00329851EE
MELLNKLKVHRAIHNLTQAELALKVGVSRKTINTVENGIFIPSTVLALKVAEVLNVTVEDIFSLK